MESISIRHGSDVLETATVTETVVSGGMTVRKGVSRDGNAFVTVDERNSRVIVVTALSSGSAILIGAV